MLVVRLKLDNGKVLPITCKDLIPDELLKGKVRIVEPVAAPALITSDPKFNLRPGAFWVVDVDSIAGYADGELEEEVEVDEVEVDEEPEEAAEEKPKKFSRKQTGRSRSRSKK